MEKETLNFIGNGSCFNTEFGNIAAYYKEEQGKRLLLIDCGESIFERVRKLKLLEKAEEYLVKMKEVKLLVCILMMK